MNIIPSEENQTKEKSEKDTVSNEMKVERKLLFYLRISDNIF